MPQMINVRGVILGDRIAGSFLRTFLTSDVYWQLLTEFIGPLLV